MVSEQQQAEKSLGKGAEKEERRAKTKVTCPKVDTDLSRNILAGGRMRYDWKDNKWVSKTNISCIQNRGKVTSVR